MYIPGEAPPTHEWEYFKISKHIEFHMQPQENMDGIYEPIMIVRPRHTDSAVDKIADSRFAGDRDLFPPRLQF